MAEDEHDALFLTKISEPVPAEETLDCDDQILAVGLERSQELLAVAVELSVEESFAGLIEDTEVEATRVEVDTAVVPMLLGVESHGGLLSHRPTSLPRWQAGGGLNQYPYVRADS
jgi:hypothetical protein